MIEEFEKEFGGYFEFKFESIDVYKDSVIIILNDEERISKSLIEDLENSGVKYYITVEDEKFILMVWDL